MIWYDIQAEFWWRLLMEKENEQRNEINKSKMLLTFNRMWTTLEMTKTNQRWKDIKTWMIWYHSTRRKLLTTTTVISHPKDSLLITYKDRSKQEHWRIDCEYSGRLLKCEELPTMDTSSN